MKDPFGTERDGNGKKIGTPQGAPELKAMLVAIRKLTEEYEQWNSWERDDGIIVHTDAIHDFLGWLDMVTNRQ